MDLNELKQLLQILEEKDIAEFEFEEEGRKLRIRKAATTPSGNQPPAPVPVLHAATLAASAPAPAAPEPVATLRAEDDGLEVVKSPIVGTFYRSPDPNSPPFVKVGDAVKVGQVLCIIEAMKLMNEIEAEMAGEIVKIHPENGQPVQYGEPLFALRPVR